MKSADLCGITGITSLNYTYTIIIKPVINTCTRLLSFVTKANLGIMAFSNLFDVFLNKPIAIKSKGAIINNVRANKKG